MTAYTGSIVVAPKNGGLGDQHQVVGKITLGATVVSGDTWTISGLLGNGEKKIVSYSEYGQELDTNASPTLTMITGTETDDNGFLTSIVAGGAGAQLNYGGNGALIGTVTSDSDLVITTAGTLGTGAATGDRFYVITLEGV